MVMEYKRRMRCVLGSRISAKTKVARRISMLTKPSTPKRAPRKTTSKLFSRMNKRLLLASLILICASSGLVMIIAGSQLAPAIIGSRGDLMVYGVGVYKDANCSINVTSLNWGTVEPSSLENITLYIRNEGNHAATLFLETNNWSPINATNYMALSWNYSGKMLNPMESVGVTLTLSVSSAANNITDFSFNVIIGTS